VRPFNPTVRRIPGLTNLQPLGRGGMSEVYQARWRRRKGALVAVKVLKDEACSGPYCDYAARFERESRAAISLTHPNLVEAYATGKVDDRPYLIMELLAGASADRQVILNGPFPLDRALAVAEQIGRALAYMHLRGYVHRDVKPSNILFTTDGVPKLTDFGLAVNADDPAVAMAGGVMGTPHYIAPEQLEGREVDHRADIYSLGLTLYFLAVGEPPFKGASVAAVLTRQLTDAVLFPPRWNGGERARVRKLIERMTAKAPAARYQNMAEALGDLAWAKGETDAPIETAVFAARRRIAPEPGRRRHGSPAEESALPIEAGRVVNVPAGAVLFYEDDVADAVYWLLSGKMEVLRGGRRAAVIAQSQKVIGEMGLVPGTLRSATLRAMEDCRVLRVNNSELSFFLAQHRRLLHSILVDLSARLERASEAVIESEAALDDLRNSLRTLAERLERRRGAATETARLLRQLADNAEQ
jgi:CRP-like cAMP-binding protein/tRNA A-37 threonylcarbamoyl transferase component Bud32